MIKAQQLSPTNVGSTLWLVDSTASRVAFAVNKRHLLVRRLRIEGRFSEVAGTIRFDPGDPRLSSAEICIGAASVTTVDPQARRRMARREAGMRDAHLRRQDFFDAGLYPNLTFRSTNVEVVDARTGRYRLHGELTIKNTTREIQLEARYRVDETSVSPSLEITASTTIDRHDFGLAWNKVLINIDSSVDLDVVLRAVSRQPGDPTG